jgi:transcriptional regulator with XRE-family HTH domain
MKLQEDITERMHNPAFAAAYEALAPEFQVARQVIALRLQRGLTQKELAERVGTKQSGISRLESMEQLPSLSFLKRVAEVLNAQLQIQLVPREGTGQSHSS